MQSAELAMIDSVRLTVSLTVCHTLISCQNDSSYGYTVFIGK